MNMYFDHESEICAGLAGDSGVYPVQQQLGRLEAQGLESSEVHALTAHSLTYLVVDAGFG